jgi:glutamyl endopeptidase
MYDQWADDFVDELEADCAAGADCAALWDADELDAGDEDVDYSVIGPTDDRFPISSVARFPSTRFFPYTTICLLERVISPTARRPRGSGTLIAPRVVLTARHVLSGVQRLRVTPGADFCAASRRTVATPAFQEAASAQFRLHPTLDFGIIILPAAFRLPNHRGGPRPSPYPFMMLQPRGDANTATLLTIAGYPCDKPLGTMWGHSNRIPLTGVSATHLRYTIDTCPGHSGSPIWLLGNNGIRLLLGVHTSGPAGCDNDPRPGRQCRRPRCGQNFPVSPVAGRNTGVRVTCEVIRAIQAWCRQAGVAGPIVDNRQMQRRCGSA